MSKKKYDEAFVVAFEIEKISSLSDLKYESIPEWDSIRHISLLILYIG